MQKTKNKIRLRCARASRYLAEIDIRSNSVSSLDAVESISCRVSYNASIDRDESGHATLVIVVQLAATKSN